MKNNIKCFIYDLRKDTVFFRCRYIQNKLFYPLISLENWIDSKKTKKTKIKIAHFECAQYSQDLYADGNLCILYSFNGQQNLCKFYFSEKKIQLLRRRDEKKKY